jgi:hypothetical protein
MFGKFFASKTLPSGARRRARTRHLMVEHLEDRVTPAPFTPGDLVLVRVGTGAGALTSNATETFLDEYTTSGVFTNNSVALPTDPTNALTLSGTGTTEGYLAGSVDGHSLTLGGYNVAPGNPTFNAANPVNRVIGVVRPDGSIDTSTQFPQDDAPTIRSAASIDGRGFWIATSNFARYIPFGNAGTSTTVLSTLVASPTVAELFPATGLSQTSQLYIDGGAGGQPNGFPAIDSPATVGTGLPTTSGQNVIVPAEFPTSSVNGAFPTSNQFAISPDGNTVYIADGRTNGDGGLLTYHRVNGNALYQRVPGRSVTFPTFGLRGLVADFSSGSGTVTLYGTTTEGSANQLIKFVDNGSGTSSSTLAKAATNEVFRGVSFTPTVPGATPSAVALTINTNTGTTYGAEPTLQATVSGSGPTPTGWVSFLLMNPSRALTEIGGAPVVGGKASLTAYTNLPAGTDNVVAVYTGDSTYGASHSSSQVVAINPAPTSAVVSFSVNPIGTGSFVTLTASITVSTAQANGYGVQPTGTVTFYAGGNQLGQASVTVTQSVVNQNGQPVQVNLASLKLAFRRLGNYQITAAYSGDNNDSPTNAPAKTLVVVYSTVTTVTTSDPNPLGSAHTPVTLTATVTSAGGTPTGTVTFYDDLIKIGTATLDGNGVGSVTVTTNSVQAPSGQADLLTPGLHSITAIYTPDASGQNTFYTSQGVYEQSVQSDPFAPGDLFVFRLGDGTTSIIAPPGSPYQGVASIGNTIFVDEYTPPGGTGKSTLVQSIILPTADGTLTSQYDQRMIHAVVADGQQSATGQLSLSLDGGYLFLTGYDSNPLPIATAPELHYVNTTSRAVARIGSDGTVETIGFVAGPITGQNSPPVQTGGNINGVFSPDGNQFYVSGFNGVDYFANFAPSVDLQSFTSRINLSNFTVVGLESDGANLFAAGGSSPNQIVGQVGTGFPTMPASITTIPGFPGTTNTSPFPIDTYFTHLDGPGAPAGINTLYVADDGPSFSHGTITKWSFDGTTWKLTDTVQADGMTVVSFYWLAGQTSNNAVTLYSTYGNGGNADTGRGDLYQVIDTAGYGQPFSSTAVTTIASVSGTSLENFRGVAFAPEPGGTGPRISGIHSSVVGPFMIFQRTGTVYISDSPGRIGAADLNATGPATLSTDSLTAYDGGSSVNRSGSSDGYHQLALDAASAGTAQGLNSAVPDDSLVWFGSDLKERILA